jgi:hypothetical protein
MKHFFKATTFVAGFAFLSISSVALAQSTLVQIVPDDKATTDQVEGTDKAPAKPVKELSKAAKGFKKYKDFLNGEMDAVGKDDRYGVTAQLPKGYLSIKWDYTTMSVDSRYNDKHQIGPAMNPFGIGGGQFLNLGLSGKGGGHVFQASYGILGNFDWYFELPYQFMHVRINPELLDAQQNPIKNPIDPTDKKYAGRMGISKLYELIPKLGRPVPALRYDADWVLSDINTGFSWNPWRTKNLSTSLTARIFIPTGRVAAANSNLTMATGPEIDVGVGSWGVGFTSGWDLRLFKYKYWIDIILSSEFSASYYFAQKRDYPTNFTTEPSQAALQAFNDPTAAAQFPDLRHLKGQYTYTPGFGLSWSAQFGIQIALFGFKFQYGIQHSQAPEIQGDWYFTQMVNSLQLVGQSTVQAIGLGASISLLPLYLPIDIAFSWRKMVDGYNSLAMENYYNVVVKAYIPLNTPKR